MKINGIITGSGTLKQYESYHDTLNAEPFTLKQYESYHDILNAELWTLKQYESYYDT